NGTTHIHSNKFHLPCYTVFRVRSFSKIHIWFAETTPPNQDLLCNLYSRVVIMASIRIKESQVRVIYVILIHYECEGTFQRLSALEVSEVYVFFVVVSELLYALVERGSIHAYRRV